MKLNVSMIKLTIELESVLKMGAHLLVPTSLRLISETKTCHCERGQKSSKVTRHKKLFL